MQNIKLKPVIDESLIAGFVVEYGSSAIDLSGGCPPDAVTLVRTLLPLHWSCLGTTRLLGIEAHAIKRLGWPCLLLHISCQTKAFRDAGFALSAFAHLMSNHGAPRCWQCRLCLQCAAS